MPGCSWDISPEDWAARWKTASKCPSGSSSTADESTPTIKKRFDGIGVESTEDNRRAYRELLFTTEGVGEYISGVILFDETLRQSGSAGRPFPQVLQGAGILPAIKVDKGAQPLAGASGEKVMAAAERRGGRRVAGRRSFRCPISRGASP